MNAAIIGGVAAIVIGIAIVLAIGQAPQESENITSPSTTQEVTKEIIQPFANENLGDIMKSPATQIVSQPQASQPSCDTAYPTICIPTNSPDLDCDELGYSNFRVTGYDRHGFDDDYDGIGCEVGSPASSNSVESTPSCDPSYPDVCIAAYPPDLDCGEIGYSNFRVTGSDPHGFDRDRDGIGCES